eukprot:TRINITY_DN5699_c0_g1_i1.p1 TRINITY_DN5699_c0_g1~~TRINITY_DN5699_c0_g1_i1.p1  ORF type:complete len:655 (-),score=120.60 TRINITY_DN5699_c0_g1_i1:588-2552(-)
MSSSESHSDTNQDEHQKKTSKKEKVSSVGSKDKGSKRKMKAEPEEDGGPKNALKSPESPTEDALTESVKSPSEKAKTKKKSTKNVTEGDKPASKISLPDPVTATVDSTSYTITVDSSGVSFSSKSKGVQIVRWQFVVGAAVMAQASTGESVSFLFCQMEKLKDKKSDDVQEETPQLKPSDPEQFSALKVPKLKLATWNLKFESAEIASAWVANLHIHLQALGQQQGLRISVFLNPFSGTKKAMKIWKKVEPIFKVNGAVINFTETQYAGHCEEEVQKVDLTQVDRFITVSGDGLLNEMLNGLMARPDWVDAVKIPLGIIPAGSGNALATSMGYPNPVSAALAIVRGRHRPVDLMAFFQQEIAEGEKEPTPNAPFKLIRYGFEALMWGIIADVDIESEKYRWMGSARFTVATIPHILNPRYYPGKFLYLPASEKVKTDYDVCQLPSSPCSTCLSHDARHEMLNSISIGTSKKHKKAKKLYQGRAAGLEQSASLTYRPNDLANPTADLPEDWKCIDGPFVYFVAANITHISNDVLSTPFAHCSDGSVDVAITRTFNDRTKMLSIFATELESGKYVRHDMMEYVKARAFILIPEGPKKGIMDVDGEPLPGAPIAVEIHRGVLSFCCANWNATLSITSAESEFPPPRASLKRKKESGK